MFKIFQYQNVKSFPHAMLILVIYWEFTKKLVRAHIRWRTVIYSDRLHHYEPLHQGLTTSQTLYCYLPVQKRKQLQQS